MDENDDIWDLAKRIHRERDLSPQERPDRQASEAEQPGTVIDRYKLLEQIGEGGFGIVYHAEQEKPIRRKVALKILKPGMDSRQIIARFEAERQALALMDHPNIARVIDAGTSPSGRPYFVMELVRGIPITAFCDERRLTVTERLQLFIEVCDAVHHAHQKAIIHRDIKPSNVLVGLDGDRPFAKVIDFGIAKALGQELTDKTLFTRHFQVMGTPQYLSPEQATLSALDIDIRADIYSLGVLLYELLTGTTPLRKEELFSAGIEAMCQLIREKEPPKPSIRITTMGEDERKGVAVNRETDPQRLGIFLAGDLDWIILKALEKDRSRRYADVREFGQDIGRHLRDEVVEARPPSKLYRTRKFVMRNRGAVAAGAGLLLSLVLGLVASLWQADLARRAEHEKGIEAAKALAAGEVAATSAKRAQDAELNLRVGMAESDFRQASALLKPEIARQGRVSWQDVRQSALLLSRAVSMDPGNAVARERLSDLLQFRNWPILRQAVQLGSEIVSVAEAVSSADADADRIFIATRDEVHSYDLRMNRLSSIWRSDAGSISEIRATAMPGRLIVSAVEGELLVESGGKVVVRQPPLSSGRDYPDLPFHYEKSPERRHWICPNGRHLLKRSENVLGIHRVEEPALKIAEITGPDNPAWDISFNRSGELMVFEGVRGVRTWDVATGTMMDDLASSEAGEETVRAWFPSSEDWAIVYRSGRCALRNVRSGIEKDSGVTVNLKFLFLLEPSLDASSLAVVSMGGVEVAEHAEVVSEERLWINQSAVHASATANDGNFEYFHLAHIENGKRGVVDVGFSPSGRRLAVRTTHAVHLHRVGDPIDNPFEPIVTEGAPSSIVFIDEDSLLVTSGKRIEIWGVPRSAEMADQDTEVQDLEGMVAVSSVGDFALVVLGGRLCAFDLVEKKISRRYSLAMTSDEAGSKLSHRSNSPLQVHPVLPLVALRGIAHSGQDSDGTRLAPSETQLLLWDIKEDRPAGSVDFNEAIADFAFLHAPPQLVALGASGVWSLGLEQDGRLGKNRPELAVALDGSPETTYPPFSPFLSVGDDGLWVGVVDTERHLAIFDRANWSQVGDIQLPEDVRAFGMLEEQDRVAVAMGDNLDHVQWWDIRSSKPSSPPFALQEGQQIHELTISRGGERVGISYAEWMTRRHTEEAVVRLDGETLLPVGSPRWSANAYAVTMASDDGSWYVSATPESIDNEGMIAVERRIVPDRAVNNLTLVNLSRWLFGETLEVNGMKTFHVRVPVSKLRDLLDESSSASDSMLIEAVLGKE